MLKCFGYNYCGQLGLGNTNDQFGVASIESFPKISSVHCGWAHTFILNGKNINLKININK